MSKSVSRAINPWSRLTHRDPPIAPSCLHEPACWAFLAAPRCRCGRELDAPCRVPFEGDTRACFARCGGRYTFYRGAWISAGSLPVQWSPPRAYTRPVPVLQVLQGGKQTRRSRP